MHIKDFPTWWAANEHRETISDADRATADLVLDGLNVLHGGQSNGTLTDFEDRADEVGKTRYEYTDDYALQNDPSVRMYNRLREMCKALDDIDNPPFEDPLTVKGRRLMNGLAAELDTTPEAVREALTATGLL